MRGLSWYGPQRRGRFARYAVGGSVAAHRRPRHIGVGEPGGNCRELLAVCHHAVRLHKKSHAVLDAGLVFGRVMNAEFYRNIAECPRIVPRSRSNAGKEQDCASPKTSVLLPATVSHSA